MFARVTNVTKSLLLQKRFGKYIKSNTNAIPPSVFSSPVAKLSRAFIGVTKLSCRKVPIIHAEFGRALTVRPLSSASIDPSPKDTEQYKERTIDWCCEGEARKLKFRLTCKGIDYYTPVAGMTWKIPGGDIIPPFFNREDVLQEILEAQYENMYLGSQKPTFSIQMMSPGSGKTRILAEWIMHAFANQNVISKFLDRVDKVWRKQFLNQLYWSSYKQHTIIAKGSSWQPKSESLEDIKNAVLDVIKNTIVMRHEGQNITFDQKEIYISDTTAADNFGLIKVDITKLVKLFVALADKTYEDPETLPFPEEGLPDPAHRRSVCFSIDECQFVGKPFAGANKEDVLYTLFRSVAATSLPALRSANITPFWFAVGTSLAGKLFSLEGEQSQFYITIKSLESLLNIKYLARICEQYFEMKLTEKYYKSPVDLPEMPDVVARALVRNYLKTFGNPRAVEYFVVKALVMKEKHMKHSKFEMDRMKLLDVELGKELELIFRAPPVEGPKEAIELLNLSAALCMPMKYDEIIPGLNVSPKQLETAGYLCIWKREQQYSSKGLAKFYFARPFFTLTKKDLMEELEVLRCKQPTSEYWKPLPISLSSLVLEKDCADYIDQNDVKGVAFEVAVASSLYARYILAQKEDVPLAELFPAQHLTSTLMKATVKLNGVVKLSRQIRARSEFAPRIFDEIIAKKVIAIDVGNSSFADVLLPITIEGKPSILAFQCKQYAAKPPLDALASNCKKVIKRKFYYVAISPEQNTNEENKLVTARTSLRTKNMYKERAFVAEAKELVSPVYLVGMDFVPHEFAAPAPVK